MAPVVLIWNYSVFLSCQSQKISERTINKKNIDNALKWCVSWSESRSIIHLIFSNSASRIFVATQPTNMTTQVWKHCFLDQQTELTLAWLSNCSWSNLLATLLFWQNCTLDWKLLLFASEMQDSLFTYRLCHHYYCKPPTSHLRTKCLACIAAVIKIVGLTKHEVTRSVWCRTV